MFFWSANHWWKTFLLYLGLVTFYIMIFYLFCMVFCHVPVVYSWLAYHFSSSCSCLNGQELFFVPIWYKWIFLDKHFLKPILLLLWAVISLLGIAFWPPFYIALGQWSGNRVWENLSRAVCPFWKFCSLPIGFCSVSCTAPRVHFIWSSVSLNSLEYDVWHFICSTSIVENGQP